MSSQHLKGVNVTNLYNALLKLLSDEELALFATEETHHTTEAYYKVRIIE